MEKRDLSIWQGVDLPKRQAIEGRYVRLEPLSTDPHFSTLFEAATAPGSDDRFRWLPEKPHSTQEDFGEWLNAAEIKTDPLFFAVVDKSTGRAEGRQALMRMDAANGVIEVGNVMWGPRLARTRMATEALYLFADLVFSLGYRRFEWKCNNLNDPSKRAALRFGFSFEGIFRQHMIVKGENRDTAWFAMIDEEWPRLKAAYEAWLAPENFDENAQQKAKLAIS